MSTNNVQVHASSPSPQTASAPPPPPTSSARLLVLLGLLIVAIGALAYDFFVAKPGAEAADTKIHDFVDKRNRMSVKDAEPVSAKEISDLLGMKPMFVDKHPADNYEVEYYCWWGPVPLINTYRQYITVVYYGINEPRRYSSHHLNMRPPEEALPIPQEPGGGKEGSETIAAPDNAKPAEADAKTEGDVKAEPDAPASAPEQAKSSADEPAPKESPAKEP